MKFSNPLLRTESPLRTSSTCHVSRPTSSKWTDAGCVELLLSKLTLYTSISSACSRYLPPRPIFHEFRGSPTDLQRSPCRSACPNPCPGNIGMHFLETHIHKASRALEAPWNQAPDIIVQNDLSQAVAKHVKLPYPWKSGSEVGSFVRKI